MQAKTVWLAPASTRSRRKALQGMYARRSAIRKLIRCLEEYNRYRARRLKPPKRYAA